MGVIVCKGRSLAQVGKHDHLLPKPIQRQADSVQEGATDGNTLIFQLIEPNGHILYRLGWRIYSNSFIIFVDLISFVDRITFVDRIIYWLLNLFFLGSCYLYDEEGCPLRLIGVIEQRFEPDVEDAHLFRLFDDEDASVRVELDEARQWQDLAAVAPLEEGKELDAVLAWRLIELQGQDYRLLVATYCQSLVRDASD